MVADIPVKPRQRHINHPGNKIHLRMDPPVRNITLPIHHSNKTLVVTLQATTIPPATARVATPAPHRANMENRILDRNTVMDSTFHPAPVPLVDRAIHRPATVSNQARTQALPKGYTGPRIQVPLPMANTSNQRLIWGILQTPVIHLTTGPITTNNNNNNNNNSINTLLPRASLTWPLKVGMAPMVRQPPCPPRPVRMYPLLPSQPAAFPDSKVATATRIKAVPVTGNNSLRNRVDMGSMVGMEAPHLLLLQDGELRMEGGKGLIFFCFFLGLSSSSSSSSQVS